MSQLLFIESLLQVSASLVRTRFGFPKGSSRFEISEQGATKVFSKEFVRATDEHVKLDMMSIFN